MRVRRSECGSILAYSVTVCRRSVRWLSCLDLPALHEVPDVDLPQNPDLWDEHRGGLAIAGCIRVNLIRYNPRSEPSGILFCACSGNLYVSLKPSVSSKCLCTSSYGRAARRRTGSWTGSVFWSRTWTSRDWAPLSLSVRPAVRIPGESGMVRGEDVFLWTGNPERCWQSLVVVMVSFCQSLGKYRVVTWLCD